MGSPDDCEEQLSLWAEAAGADYVIMRFRLPMGPEPGRVLECIHRFGTDVVPRFADV